MKINDELITYMENLSGFFLTAGEREQFKGEFDDIFDYFSRIEKADVSNIGECRRPFDNINIFREDTAADSCDRELILKNAPDQAKGMFKVPRAL
ncbi:MAG: Asp-tRNA(Asn)/Glu-tRNA(Gln) amidotransferase subunit GatC [Oscillospiraceae bacterium]|nr:Asp-tRNA(Asn)/Glu-tRNA(Gln) amidotransferase subunit GatC [Oscillospiraceae bacterium]